MPTFVGEAPLAALKTLFTQIGDAGVTTWAQTKRPTVLRERLPDRVLPTTPIILIVGASKEWKRMTANGSSNIYDVYATVVIKCFFGPQSWNPDTDAEVWEHDLAKAIRDFTLGGAVIDSEITGTIVGLPAPDDDPTCRITMTMRIHYRTSDQDPSVQIA